MRGHPQAKDVADGHDGVAPAGLTAQRPPLSPEELRGPGAQVAEQVSTPQRKAPGGQGETRVEEFHARVCLAHPDEGIGGDAMVAQRPGDGGADRVLAAAVAHDEHGSSHAAPASP